jgi:hypothetical protein
VWSKRGAYGGFAPVWSKRGAYGGFAPVWSKRGAYGGFAPVVDFQRLSGFRKDGSRNFDLEKTNINVHRFLYLYYL